MTFKFNSTGENGNNVGSENIFIEIQTSFSQDFFIVVIYCHPTHAFQSFQDEFVELVTSLKLLLCYDCWGF